MTLLSCLVCLSALAVSGISQRQQQQSPPIWDREGIPVTNKQTVDQQTEPAQKTGQGAMWQRYSSAGEEFSALFPARPSLHIQYRPKKSNWPQQERIYGAYADGIVYVIISLENKRQKESLENFANEFEKYQTGGNEMTFEREVTHSGYKGKRHRINFHGVEGTVDFYQTSNHTYIVEVVGGDAGNPSVNRFFQSLVLGEHSSLHKSADDSSDSRLQSAQAPPHVDDAAQSPDADKALSPRDVVRKAIVVFKPEPSYTDVARQKGVQGTVVLRAILSSSGEVTGIRAVRKLSDGLTEQAINAAQSLRFIPAMKDGRYVSQYVQIEYNFNLY
jgi:TonB family protein